VGKGQDFSPLLRPVEQHVKAVILMGEDAPKIQHVLEPLGKTMVCVQSLAQAVSAAQELTQTGDLVLLSPACASFDMFKDYAHRAQVFEEAVNHLSQLRPLGQESIQASGDISPQVSPQAWAQKHHETMVQDAGGAP
jgi:UDP-N-acetylmuramoylalanine--D-glutamate ligase